MEFSEQINILADKIKSAKNIAILMHNNPDGDAFGAASALHELILTNFEKDSTLIYSGKIPNFLMFLPNISTAINTENIDVKSVSFDLVIVVDTSNFKLLDETALNIIKSADYTVKIDHHKDSDNFANLNIHEVCPAASEIIYKIATTAKWQINKDAATSLYTGIFCDTGHFSFFEKPETLIACANLIDLGANAREINNSLSITEKASTIMTASIVVDAEFLFEDRLTISLIDKEKRKIIDGKGSEAMLMLRNIDTVEYMVFIKETDDNKVHISFRSRSFPVNQIAAKFGGGGHMLAAACIFDGTLQEAHAAVLSEFEKIL